MERMYPLFAILFILLLTACGGGESSNKIKAGKNTGDVKTAKIEEAIWATLSDEGETNFSIEFRNDEKTQTGIEHYKSYGAIPFQTYFVRSKSNWNYKGSTLDVYRHFEVKYYKISGDWTLDKARIFNSWLDKVQNPIKEQTILNLIKKDTWGTFGHSKAIIESITPVKDFYNGMPGIHNGQLYPGEYSSKQVKVVYDIVFEDKGHKKGRYEIKFGRGDVDQPWNRTVSYRRIHEEAL